MRLRNDPKAQDILLANQKWFIQNPFDYNFLSYAKKPIYLEIGSGKGEFIINQSLQNPKINFIGLERNLVVCSKIIKKILKTEQNLDNLIVFNNDAKDLIEIFKDIKVSKIFLNFSDPWPKKRHEKNRLTNPKFLEVYRKIIVKDGLVEFKTDNDGLFKYTLEVLNENKDKYQIIYKTSNLYAELNHEYNVGNIQTEYERKFHNMNKNINKVIFKFI